MPDYKLLYEEEKARRITAESKLEKLTKILPGLLDGLDDIKRLGMEIKSKMDEVENSTTG